MNKHYSSSSFFNSKLETGIRALVILEAMYPQALDLTEMTWLDYFVVHTADIDEDKAIGSLHPDLPNREGELLVRRKLIQESLNLIQRLHLIDVKHSDNGIQYLANDDSPSVLNLLQAPYTIELRNRAKWLANRFSAMSPLEIRNYVEEKIGRWTAEFHIVENNISLRNTKL